MRPIRSVLEGRVKHARPWFVFVVALLVFFVCAQPAPAA